MRIKRIKSNIFMGLGDVDWIFPLGPVLLSFEDKRYQKLFSDLLLTLFYDQQESPLILEQPENAFVEVWMSGESSSYHIHLQFIENDNKLEWISTLIDQNGQTVCLPNTVTLGEYLFKVQQQAFLQGGIVEWPENDNHNYLIQRIHNLRQGGDEELSLTKVRASIAGAQKRVNEQKESMSLVKAEYDALRSEWETAHRHQDDERLLQIELRKLQEKEMLFTEKITCSENLQKRLEFLAQNPDYRELRRLQDEINRLEERLQNIDANLTLISTETYLDRTVIEGLREECVEWACLQNNLARLVDEVQAQSKQIDETQTFLLASGYEGVSENEDQFLRKAIEERDTAQKKLNKLIVTKRGLLKLKSLYTQESTRFEDLAVMADVTEGDTIQLAQKEKNLEQWRDSKVGSILDRTLRKRLGVTSIAERLSSRLLQYYKRYHVTSYQEFMIKLNQFLDQQKRVKKMQRQIERLQEKVRQESEIRRIVHSRNEILKNTFSAVKALDFLEWQRGWEDYRQKKRQLALQLNELHLEQEKQLVLEKKLTACAELLREKLKNWGIPIADREGALAAVLKVADQLQEREDVKREIAAFSEKFNCLLGDRNMEQLSNTLEPLAELEREKRLANEVRLAEKDAWYKELIEIRRYLVTLKQRLQSSRTTPSLSFLEKKIEVVKRRWTAYEDLRSALVEAQDLLELSWQEWQTKHEKLLSDEKTWVYEHGFSSVTLDSETIGKRDYFSYRMSVAQLALRGNTELPLFFLVGKLKIEDQIFWEEVTEYLLKLSLSRQIIFCATDYRLREKLSGRGWSHKVDNNGRIIENDKG